MIDLSGIGTGAFKMLSSFLFWGIALLILLVLIVGGLMVRKKRKLKFPAVEITDLGAGKVGLRSTKAGWFKTKTFLFGMWDYGGEDVMKLKDGRKVQDVSSEDFHDINGTRGLLIVRKPDDPQVLLPIGKAGSSDYYTKQEIIGKDGKPTGKYKLVPKDTKAIKGIDIVNNRLLLEIAPGDFRHASSEIAFNAEKETMSKLEKILPYVSLGLMAVAFIIAIILIIQMVKQGQAEAKDLILEAGRMNKENLKIVCDGLLHQATSTASSVAP